MTGPRAIRVIGVDPGLSKTGWGVVSALGPRLSFVACGVVATRATEPLSERLAALHDGLRAVLEEYRPDAAAVEETFVNKDARGALKLGHARAIALLAPAQAGLDVGEYAPNQVKKTVVGVGHAEKAQVAHMVKRLLPGAAPQSADAADALAVAICHALTAPATARLAQAARSARGAA